MKQFQFVFVALLIALMSLTSKNQAAVSPADNSQGIVITGLPAGFSNLSSTKEQELERMVLFQDPAKKMIRIIGLADQLGWAKLPQSQWQKADSAVAQRRANRVAAFYMALGWEVETVGVEIQTQFRGVRIEIIDRVEVPDIVEAPKAEMTAPADTTKPDTVVKVVERIETPEKKSASLFVGGMLNSQFSIGGAVATLPITQNLSVMFGGGMGSFREAIPPQSQFDLWTSGDSRRLEYSHYFEPGGWKQKISPIVIGGIKLEDPLRDILRLFGKGGAK